MKCELCHKAEAETAIRKVVDGEEQELYVCRTCAKADVEEGKPRTETAPSSSDDVSPLSALPLMGMILDAAFEIVGRAAATQAEPSCPVCGITRAEYRKASRLGCPACYEAFANELDGAILDMHRSRQHVGKVPAKAHAARRRQQLVDELDAAVKGQRYEEAIALRDRLRKLDESGDRTEAGGPA